MRRHSPQRGTFTAGAVGIALTAGALGLALAAASFGDAPSLDVLACIRFYLAYGCPP
jgi:hypothetical protein